MSLVKRNILWGIRYGLAAAVLYSILVSIQYILVGSRSLEGRGVTLLSTIVVYFVGGIAGGALVGVLRPLTRWRLGSAVVGVVVCFPLAAASLVAIDGPIASWQGKTVFGGVFAAVFVGVIAGCQAWERPS